MKKTILALAITGLFATSAQAVTLYDADGMSVDVFGDLEVRFQKKTADNSKKEMETNDSDFGFKVTQAVNDDISAFGSMEFIDDATRDTAFVGLSNEIGTVTAGIQYTVYDDAGIINDYVFDISDARNDGGAYGEQVVKVTFAQGNFYGAAAYANLDNDKSILDGKIGMTMDNLNVVLYAGSYDDGADTATNVLVEATYSMDDLTLAITGSTSDYKDETPTAFGAQAAYTMDKLTYSVAAGISDSDVDGEDSLVEYLAGVEYALASSAIVYAQIGGNDADGSEFGYAAGMKISF